MGVNLNASLSLSPSVPLLPSSFIMFYANHSTATEAMSFIYIDEGHGWQQGVGNSVGT